MTGTTIDERNGALFYQIADILEFMPQAYDQETWGTFNEDTLVEADFAAFAERWGVTVAQAEHLPTDDKRWLEVKECNTQKCVAGHAAALSGWHPVVSHDGDTLNWGEVAREPLTSCVDDSTMSVDVVARRELGVNEEEAERLFASVNVWTPKDLREFAVGRPIVLPCWDDDDDE